MYNLEALRRKVRKEGLEITLKHLALLPESIKKTLAKDNVFLESGEVNTSLVASLISDVSA